MLWLKLAAAEAVALAWVCGVAVGPALIPLLWDKIRGKQPD